VRVAEWEREDEARANLSTGSLTFLPTLAYQRKRLQIALVFPAGVIRDDTARSSSRSRHFGRVYPLGSDKFQGASGDNPPPPSLSVTPKIPAPSVRGFYPDCMRRALACRCRVYREVARNVRLFYLYANARMQRGLFVRICNQDPDESEFIRRTISRMDNNHEVKFA